MTRHLILGAVLAGLAVGCGSTPPPTLTGTGSSFIAPMMTRWKGDYASKGAVNYESVGSTQGVQQLNTGAFDFACTDAPLSKDELEKARKARGEVIHIPLVLGAVVAAYNLDAVKEPLTFSGPVLADIYLGKITRWNDKALKELNPGAALPDAEILAIHRDDSSGTSHTWTEYLAKVSPEWKHKVGVSASPTWPAGVAARGSEGVTTRLKNTPGALAYLPLAYILENDLKAGLVKNREGVAVKPTLQSVTAAASAALPTIPDDLSLSLTDPPGQDSYPICSATWAVLFVRQSPEKARALVAFLRWATHEGQASVDEQQYARLPDGLVERIDQKLAQVGAKP
jgi:phosphate transport system substrate-binding protein